MIDLDRDPPSHDSLSDNLLREIVEMTTVPAMEPGDITVAMFAAFAKIPPKTARSRLDALVRDGIMEVAEGKRRNEDNRPVCVWRRAQE